MADTNLLIRVLIVGDEGEDVYAIKRAITRLLKLGSLGDLESKPDAVRNRFQVEWIPIVKRAQKHLGLPQDGRVGPGTERALRKAKAFDANATKTLATYREKHMRPRLVYPHPVGYPSTVCQGLHETLGIDGNWAVDFCTTGGTPVVCSFEAEVTKMSGRDPNSGWDQNAGVGGWSIHYVSLDNVYHAFSTHYGTRTVREGQQLRPGDVIGTVARWPGNAGRSHTHLGIDSRHGSMDAQNLVLAITRAPRIEV